MHHRNISAMEPMLPEQGNHTLEDLAIILVEKAHQKDFSVMSQHEKHMTVLLLLLESETIDNEKLRNLFDINYQQASTLIKSLINENIINPLPEVENTQNIN